MPRKTAAHTASYPLTSAASMRPRPDAAENIRATLLRGLEYSSFNEAAARCRGKLTAASSGVSGGLGLQ